MPKKREIVGTRHILTGAAVERRVAPNPGQRVADRVCSSVRNGDGGNRTRVRDRVAAASTSVSGALISSSGRLAGGVSEDQLPEISPVRRERTSPGKPAFDPADPRGRQAGGQRST